MSYLSDPLLGHLQRVVDWPDLAGTKYELTSRLDEGGMGVVYVARDTELHRDVAIKVLALDDPSGALAARMRREARHLASLEHPNVVPIHDVGVLPDGRAYYVMKLVRGIRLDEWAGGPHDLSARLRLFLKICEAVSFAHARGVVHRDLKPQNVMVGLFGEALVLDWGLAKDLCSAAPEGVVVEASSSVPTRTGAVVGTPGFMAPEQASGDEIDARVDVYSLGAILSFIVSRAPARPPRALRAIADCAASAKRDERYPSVSVLEQDLERLLAGRPVSAHHESALETLGRVLARNQTIVVLVVAYLLMRVLGVVFLRR